MSNKSNDSRSDFGPFQFNGSQACDRRLFHIYAEFVYLILTRFRRFQLIDSVDIIEEDKNTFLSKFIDTGTGAATGPFSKEVTHPLDGRLYTAISRSISPLFEQEHPFLAFLNGKWLVVDETW